MQKIIIIAGAVLVASPALAHVVVAPNRAEAGSYFAAAFRVGHGCEGQATTSVRVQLPETLDSARPKAVPGFKHRIERENGQVVAVTWTGRMPDEQFQEFEILMKLPSEAGTLYFPTVQTCGKLQSKWVETGPAAGSYPAPKLTIIAPRGDDHANH